MEKLKMNDLNEWIAERKPAVERMILKNRTTDKPVRTRKRDVDEQRIIDKLCIKRWEKAEQEGKVKYLTKRKWFYDFD